VRSQIEGEVAVTEGTSVQRLERTDGGLSLTLSDGTQREAAAVVVSAGFRFALDRLAFLSPALRDAVAVREGWPVLDRYFRSSDPSLLFVGFAAERRFGPIARFVNGSRFTAYRVAEGLAGPHRARG
jgi:pyruvate/2-oxoglutarate dehydrogenase complex dihydrolipoamide dehydrogenase (E3) component